ncbi:MAG: PilZ domain-containing protein [Candidatus Omnitrophota bacterium]
MMQEKRHYIRWAKKVRVTYSLTKEDVSYQEIFTEDICEIGLQILIDDELKLQQNVWIKIEFVYDAVPIIVLGRVAHLEMFGNKYRVGLEFTGMDAFSKKRLKRLLDKAAGEQSEEAGKRNAKETNG